MNSKATSVHPTNIKYRAMGTACRSCYAAEALLLSGKTRLA
jgi:hypothetical protein